MRKISRKEKKYAKRLITNKKLRLELDKVEDDDNGKKLINHLVFRRGKQVGELLFNCRGKLETGIWNNNLEELKY